jgi:hypothetical protein
VSTEIKEIIISLTVLPQGLVESLESQTRAHSGEEHNFVRRQHSVERDLGNLEQVDATLDGQHKG